MFAAAASLHMCWGRQENIDIRSVTSDLLWYQQVLQEALPAATVRRAGRKGCAALIQTPLERRVLLVKEFCNATAVAPLLSKTRQHTLLTAAAWACLPLSAVYPLFLVVYLLFLVLVQGCVCSASILMLLAVALGMPVRLVVCGAVSSSDFLRRGSLLPGLLVGIKACL